MWIYRKEGASAKPRDLNVRRRRQKQIRGCEQTSNGDLSERWSGERASESRERSRLPLGVAGLVHVGVRS